MKCQSLIVHSFSVTPSIFFSDVCNLFYRPENESLTGKYFKVKVKNHINIKPLQQSLFFKYDVLKNHKMVVGAFPVIKLGVLLMKQISKPIANFVKERAKNNPFFRTYVCMPPAQFYNWCEVKTKMWIMNLGKPIHIPTLNETMAIELGANLLGEGIIFLIASGLLIMEYQRQSAKESAKEEARVEQVETMNRTISELAFMVEKQDTQLREVLRLIGDLDSRVVKKPSWPIKSGNTAESSIKSSGENMNVVKNNNLLYKNDEYIIMNPDKILQNSLQYLEKDVWSDKNAEQNFHPGIVMKALYYLEKDLFSRK